MPHLSAHGLTENGDMVCMEMTLPENIEDLFMELDNCEEEDAEVVVL